MASFPEPTSSSPSTVLYHHDFDLRLRKANLPCASFLRCCVTIVTHVLLMPLYLCIADLQPPCPGSTHRVTVAIWYPRRSIHRTYGARFTGQKPPRCCCEGRRGARPRARGRIREETWHYKGIWRSGRISKYGGRHASLVRVRSLLSEELLDDPEIDVVYNPVRFFFPNFEEVVQALSHHSCPMASTMSGL